MDGLRDLSNFNLETGVLLDDADDLVNQAVAILSFALPEKGPDFPAVNLAMKDNYLG